VLVCLLVALARENQIGGMSLHCVAACLVWLLLDIQYVTPGRVDEGGEELLHDLQCIPTCHRGREVA